MSRTAQTPQPTDTVTPPANAAVRTLREGRRLVSIDALRGVAVFLMMEQHMGVWLYRGPRGGDSLKPMLVAFNALGGMAAPLFVTLAGVGTSLLTQKRARTGRSAGVDVLLARRGLALMGFGYLLNYLTPSWFSMGSWFVLHMMGFAMATAPLWRRLPSSALLGLALAVLGTTTAVQNALDTPMILSNARMARLTLPGGAARLALAEGQFPILPWLAMFLSGMVVGRWISDGQQHRIRRLALVTFTLAVTLIGFYLLALKGVLPWLMHPEWARLVRVRLGFYPAGPAIILLLHTGVLVLISAALALELRRPPANGDRNLLVTLGRASLTLLIVHVVVFREWSRPVGLWRGVDAGTALAIIFAWTIASAYASRLWQRVGYRFGAEWMLRKAGG